jgi:transcriptional regulator with XRE-family HTH domain
MDVRPQLLSILKDRGLTQMDLSGLSGVPQAAISRFDKTTQCKYEHLFRISRALNISIEGLFVVEEHKG